MSKHYRIFLIVSCQVCGNPVDELYCTSNTCKDCCEKGYCPMKSWCNAYPRVVRLMKKKEWNPSSRKD